MRDVAAAAGKRKGRRRSLEWRRQTTAASIWQQRPPSSSSSGLLLVLPGLWSDQGRHTHQKALARGASVHLLAREAPVLEEGLREQSNECFFLLFQN